MKNKRKILLFLFFFIGFIAFTYALDPPTPGGDPTTGGGTPVGGSAPIGSGLWFSIVLSMGYMIYIFIKRIINFKLTTHEK